MILFLQMWRIVYLEQTGQHEKVRKILARYVAMARCIEEYQKSKEVSR